MIDHFKQLNELLQRLAQDKYISLVKIAEEILSGEYWP